MQKETGTKFSLNEIRRRFEEHDIELICTRTITADIAVCYGNDESGVQHDLGLEVTLHLPLDNDEHYHAYTFLLEKPDAHTALERPLTLDDVAIALSIDPNEHIWEESDGFDSTTEKSS